MKHKTHRECPQASIQYCAVVGLLLLSMTAWAPAQADPQIAKRALAATVFLEVADSTDSFLGFGSGFFVDNNLIATNFHVIEGAAQGTAKLVGDTTEYTIEGFTASDEYDLAILKVSPKGSQPSDIQPLSLGDSDTVKIGETVYVAGNPQGLEGTFTKGIISRVQGSTRLQMDAAVSRGSSGGPVLNGKSEVIGVSVEQYKRGQNLNFAVPSNHLKALLKQDGLAEPLSSQENLSIAPATYYERGRIKFNHKEYNAAIEDYNQAIRIYDYFYQGNSDHYYQELAEAYSFRGIAKYFLAQYDAAIKDYNQAIQIYEQASRSNLAPDVGSNSRVSLIGFCYAQAQDRTGTRMACAYSLRGTAKYSLAQYKEAIEDYNQAIQLTPNFSEAYHARGRAKYSLAQYKEAIEDYNQAIGPDPDSTNLYYKPYYSRGRAKYSLAQYKEAIEDYSQTIRQNPDFAEAYYSRGRAKYSLAQYKEAIEDYDEAIRLDPDFDKAYHGRFTANKKLDNVDTSDQIRILEIFISGYSIFPPLPPE